MTIEIEEILRLKERLREINDQDLNHITFTENGQKLEINPKHIDEFLFTGLNNVDFITTEFYKHGFENDEKTSN